jgi:hypothetical protein
MRPLPLRALVLFTIMSLFTGITISCSKDSKPAEVKLPDGQLTGEVFIVTRGGQNIRLGLVEVGLIPEDQITPFIAQKQEKGKAEREKLAPTVTAAKMAEAKAKSAWKVASDATLATITNRGDFIGTQKVQDQAMKRWTAASEASNKAQAQDRYFLSGAYYFDGLPAPVVQTKTNADGKFTLALFSTKRYALAARASRNVGDTTEHYFWLNWVSLDGQKTKDILVSNDTLLQTYSATGVVRP